MKRILSLLLTVCTANLLLSAQSYTYTMEGFEESCWATADKSSNVTVSPTGAWTVAKKNVHDSSTSYEGTYSLVIATKTNALITPYLSDGAGVLSFYAARTSGTRWLAVTASKDGQTWSKALDSINLATDWTRYEVQVNDPEVHYLRFQLQSNGGVYLDNILVTKGGSSTLRPSVVTVDRIGQESAHLTASIEKSESDTILAAGFCLALHENPTAGADSIRECPATAMDIVFDGLDAGCEYHVKAWARTSKGTSYGQESTFSTRPADEAQLYFYQPYNDPDVFPTGSGSEESVYVKGQGTWLYKGCKRSTSASYITDGSASDLRVPKNGCYVVTPVLEQGVSHFSFVEGRGRDLNVYISTDKGTTWSLYRTVETSKGVYVDEWINRGDVNRIKIVNEGSSGGDADVDNVSAYVYPQGAKPSVTTFEASDIKRNTASVRMRVDSSGDNTITETGVCWSITEEIPYRYDNRVFSASSSTDTSFVLEGLPAGSLVYYRSYAVSRSGVGYGAVMSFTTQPAAVCTFAGSDVTGITSETAILNAVLSDDGGDRPGQVGYCIIKGIVKGVIGNKSARCVLFDNTFASDSFTMNVTGLKPQTTYTICAAALNKAGMAGGSDIVFTTGGIGTPELSIGNVSDITSYRFHINGTLLDDGNAPCEVGFCCDTADMPDIYSPIRIVAGKQVQSGMFDSYINGVLPKTVYHVRMYAINSADTSYSESLSLTTLTAATFWLSTHGDDANGDGSASKPYYSLSKVVDNVKPGDRIMMEGGVYHYDSRINILTSGAEGGGEIFLTSYNGRAILDFSAMADEDQNQGIRHSGSYWHYYGIDIAYAGDNGLLIERNKPTGGSYSDISGLTDQAHHNVIENCRFYGNRDSGLQLKNLAEYNLILNCDSYFNRDSSDGDADGFAPKITVGNGNYFYGCRAWNNSDDGWDSYLKCEENGFPDNIYTIVENCWAFRSGFLPDGSAGDGNGNGFKLGGNYERHNMLLIDCMAFDNLQKSFDQNHNAGDMTLVNCTGFDHPYNSNKNRYQYRIDEQDVLAEGKVLTLINDVAVWDGLEAKKTAYSPVSLMNDRTESNCNWLTAASEYLSVDTAGVTSERQEDGSLPDIPFMHMKEGNKLIDGGIAVIEPLLPASVRATIDDIRRQQPGFAKCSRLQQNGLKFMGNAPDLGCFEWEGPTSLQSVSDNGINLGISAGGLEVTLPGGIASAEMMVFDIKGTCLKQIQLQHQHTLCNLSLPSGIYIIKVKTSTSTVSAKVAY